MAKAATRDDKVTGDPDPHTWTEASGASVTSQCAFSAVINDQLSANVFIDGKEAATTGSVASKDKTGDDSVPTYAEPKPSKDGTITGGSATVLINRLGAARDGDTATCCGTGKVVLSRTRTVCIGD
jgi:uncharacterized Zn-binding protein involved in type VI secretion